MERSLLLLFSTAFLVVTPLQTARAAAASTHEQRATLVIQANGSSKLITETVQPRFLAEQQARMWERFAKTQLNEDSDEEPGGNVLLDLTTTVVASEPEEKNSKPMSDQELERKIRAGSKARAEQAQDENEATIDKVEISKDSVRTVSTRSFATLEEMIEASRLLWSETGLAIQHTRIEKDTNDHLRVTLSTQAGMQRYARNWRQQWKASGAKTEIKLVMPGKVLSSGLPSTKDNATWLSVDAHNEESMNAAMKLYETPAVITAELAGLKLDQPLDSRLAQRMSGRAGAGADLPITQAEGGFAAEAMSVTTSSLYYFPEGEKYLKQSGAYGLETGTVVQAKLFAPKGRTLQAVSAVRVLKASDDKGRLIGASDEEEPATESYTYTSSGSEKANSAQMNLKLQLPRPDAQSIDEIAAEAIAVTAGKWKELTLTNVQQNVELDLSAVLEGAKLVLTKRTTRNQQLTLQTQIKGPNTIRRLDIQCKIPGNERFNSNANERKFSAKAGQATRSVTISGYSYGGEGETIKTNAPLSLLVRYPEDLRRERVQFKLKGLDLF